ncbi:glutamate synthase beta subunit, putative, partial [Entamoeba invadens IP1]
AKVDDIITLKKEYDGVFVGIGALKPKTIGIPGENLKGVEHVIPFLESVNCHVRKTIGKNVAVVGAGFSALDAVRVARRLGSEAFIVYRRSAKEMPATPNEVEEAIAEGVKMMTLCNPTKIFGDENGNVIGLQLQRMELGEKDSTGRSAPRPIPNSEFYVECDMVIQAISQEVETETTTGITLNPNHTLTINDKYETNVKGIYACGDCTSGPKNIVHAVGDAHQAVISMDLYLKSLPTL